MITVPFSSEKGAVHTNFIIHETQMEWSVQQTRTSLASSNEALYDDLHPEDFFFSDKMAITIGDQLLAWRAEPFLDLIRLAIHT
jgi:hypothetical protein